MRITADATTQLRMIQRHWEEQQRVMQASAARLASGTRLTSAVDDAAGVAIGQRMRSGNEGARQAARNAQQGIALVQVADGALSAMSEMLQRMRVLALQSANGTYSDEQRGHLDRAVILTLDEMDAIVERTERDRVGLLETDRPALTLQIGAEPGQTLEVARPTVDRNALGIQGISVATQEEAASALDVLDAALAVLFEQRAQAAAAQNRLERAARALEVTILDTASAMSRFVDADIPREATAFVRARFVTDVGITLMDHVQRAQRQVLDLLRGLEPVTDAPREPSAAPGAVPGGPVAPSGGSPAVEGTDRRQAAAVLDARSGTLPPRLVPGEDAERRRRGPVETPPR